MKFVVFIKYCLVHLAYDWARSLFAAISVMVILCVYFLSGGLIKDLQHLSEARFKLPENLLLLMSSNAVFPGDSKISINDMVFYRTQIENSFGAGIIDSLIPLIYRQVYQGDDSVLVAGVSYEDLIKLSRLELLQGNFPDQDDEVLVNQEYNLVSGRNIGDTIEVYGREMKISGICSSSLWRNSVIIMNFTQAEALYNSKDEFQIGVITLAKDADPLIIQDAIKSIRIDQECCNIFLHDHYTALTQNALRGFRTIAQVVRIVILILLSFGAYNTAALILAEHQREVILYRVIGYSENQVHQFLFIRTLLVMLIAFLAGWTMAWIVSYIHLSQASYSLAGVVVSLRTDLTDVISALFIMVGLTALGSFLSFRKRDPLKQGINLKTTFQGRIG